MAKIQTGVADSTNTFNLNGLDYPKNRYEIYYRGKELLANGNIDQTKIAVGIRSIADKQEVIQSPVTVDNWVNSSDVAYTTLSSLISDLITFVGFSTGGGSGSGTTEIFEGADRAAAEAARDAFFTANPNERERGTTAILVYGTQPNTTSEEQFWDTSSWVSLGTSPLTGSEISTLLYAEPNTNRVNDSLFESLETIAEVSDTYIPYKSGLNEFLDSPLRVTPTEIVSTKTITVNDASLNVGNWQISNAGFSIGLKELASERVFYPILTELETSGTTEPYYWKLDPLAETAATLADKSETFTQNQIQFTTSSIDSGVAISYKFDSLTAVSDVNLVIRLNSHTDTPAIFDYKRATGGVGFNLGVGETIVNLPVLLFFETGIPLYITLESTSNLSLKGQTLTGQQTPWARVNGRVATKKIMATREYVNELEREKEEYVLVTTDNYNVTLEDLYAGKTYIVAVGTGQNWNFNLPASSTIRDDGFIYKTRVVIVGDSNESLTISITGGETFTKGMNSIKLYRNINDDVIIGVVNNVSASLAGWQREGDNRIVCNVRRNTNLAIEASSFSPIPFQLADRNTNNTITNWDLSNPNYIESLIRQECNIKYKLSVDASTGGGTWTIEAKIFIDRKQSDNSFVEEVVEISRAATGNFGGENQLLSGDADVILNAGDRVRLKYQEVNLNGNFTSAALSVTSNV